METDKQWPEIVFEPNSRRRLARGRDGLLYWQRFNAKWRTWQFWGDAQEDDIEWFEALAAERQRAEEAELVAWALAQEFLKRPYFDHPDQQWRLHIGDGSGSIYLKADERGLPILTAAARDAIKEQKP